MKTKFDIKKENNTRKIKVGDIITYRPCWGANPETTAEVLAIDLCEEEEEKYGEEVQEVDAKDVRRCCFTLNNGRWCYGTAVCL